ncbi:hypothetical protein ACWCXH_29010 [Kitasatospora sp. NPDC001660]
MSVLLALTVIVIALGSVRLVVHGVLYLLFIGIVVGGLSRLAFTASRRRLAR